jgi:hypothetical protein
VIAKLRRCEEESGSRDAETKKRREIREKKEMGEGVER